MPDHNAKALAMIDRLFPGRGRKNLEMLEQLDPEYRRLFEDYVLGGLYSRDVLDHRTRELCAVASLTVLDRAAVLGSHIRAAVRAGAARVEILEVILQTSVYGGLPIMFAGLEKMREVFAELDASPR